MQSAIRFLLVALAIVSRLNAAIIAPGEPGAIGAVKTISLPHFEPVLPMLAGHEEFMVVCVSCHSARYVTMQPHFSAIQWENIVDKMAKTYGAQMDVNQRRAIIGYLLVLNETKLIPMDKPGRSSDDDEEFASSANVQLVSESAPLLHCATEGKEWVAQVELGGRLFAQYCAACHGTDGRGDGFIAPVLLPNPENLAASRFSIQLLSEVLWNGKLGSSMPSWRSLSPAELAALATYVQTFHKSVQTVASSEALQNGGKLFIQNCSPCHGAEGDGKGTAAAPLLPKPANFKLKQPDIDYISQLLNNGVPGTAMPSWKEQLSEPNRQALAVFVRSLFESTEGAGH